MYRILIAEDDAALAAEMKKQLECCGNEVVCVKDLTRVTDEFSACAPHLVLMDIMLPFRDGFYWCGEIRRLSRVPVVFISSASDSMNIVMAVNMGGDDFIAKPVEPLVLRAKVQAVLRRTYEMGDGGTQIAFSGAVLNLQDASVTFEGTRTELTRNEFRILQTLLEHRGQIVSRDTLMTSLWQNDLYVEENTLTVNIARLRRKLEERGMKDVIITRPGSGYIIS